MNTTYIRAQQCKVKEAKFPFVKIGSQYWTTKNLSLAVTPQGTLIPEMQANANVEKITNAADREFGSDTGFWSKGGSWTISGGTVQKNTGDTGSITSSSILTIGKYYKLTIYSYTTAFVNFIFGNVYGYGSVVTGNNIIYAYCAGGTTFQIQGGGAYKFDNISIQEIGWAGSQELYDGIYTQTSGTVEQKTYAAVKAAAMWCNYNNDPVLGGIYGKLYNWFAVKLLQMDIDYYNAANPTKKWGGGWRIPTQTEFQTLSTYLGGDAVSGGHLKEAGYAHWNTSNIGSDNLSGYSKLPCGLIGDSGTFGGLGNDARVWGSDKTNVSLQSNSSVLSIVSQSSIVCGFSVRLIKA